MGCVNSISHDKFPAQADNNYILPKIGKRVAVCFHYDLSNVQYGKIVRSDIEAPFQTIIALDDGRYILDTECQYSLVD